MSERVLTVIVPMYNVARFVDRLIETLSLQNQDIIEIIFVDDGSTDHTSVALEGALKEGALEAPWRIVKKNNGGLSDARNFGLSYSRTNYVTFLDPDDLISPNFYYELVQRLEKTKSAVALSSSVEVWPDGTKKACIYEDTVHEVTQENRFWT